MLKNLSYVNIALALFYYLAYLINSNSFAALGILVVMIGNILVLINLDKNLSFTWVHYLFEALNLIFAGFLVTWTVNIFLSSIEYQYFGDSWLYILVALSLAVCTTIRSIAVYINKR